MYRNTKDLENFTISATDGHIGHVKDLYFDDHAWVIRYFVVDTGSWLSSRKVLISPISVDHLSLLGRSLSVGINKEQVKNSPSIDTDQPVSRQNEEQYMQHYGYPYYWAGVGTWGDGLYPYAMAQGNLAAPVERVERAERELRLEVALRIEQARHRSDDPHLRSCKAVTGYRIHACDGEIGHVAGYLVDDQTWVIHYLIVDTSNWFGGHKVLIAPDWIEGVHWTDETVAVDVSRESVKLAPLYDPDAKWSRNHDDSLHQHYRQLPKAC